MICAVFLLRLCLFLNNKHFHTLPTIYFFRTMITLFIKRFRCLSLLALCFPLLFIGCSDNVQIRGTVTLTDGTPVTLGSVIFENENATFSARGDIQSDGSFRMGSQSERDGLPRGEYVVYISGAMQTGSPVQVQSISGGVGGLVTEAISMPTFTPMIAPEYTSGSTSPLRFTVERSATFDIVVPPNPNL